MGGGSTSSLIIEGRFRANGRREAAARRHLVPTEDATVSLGQDLPNSRLKALQFEQVHTTWPEIFTLPGSCKPLNWNEPEASGFTIIVPMPVGKAKM